MTKIQINSFTRNGHVLMKKYFENAKQENIKNYRSLNEEHEDDDEDDESKVNDHDYDDEQQLDEKLNFIRDTFKILDNNFVQIDLNSKSDRKMVTSGDVNNIVKATQEGNLTLIRELVESGKVDPNKPDDENVYLLHWAAINNHVDIAEYLLSKGAKVDPIGGDLKTTPLNWAISSGHFEMMTLLLKHGANLFVYDTDGLSSIHIATLNKHVNIVSYLLAIGVDVFNSYFV